MVALVQRSMRARGAAWDDQPPASLADDSVPPLFFYPSCPSLSMALPVFDHAFFLPESSFFNGYPFSSVLSRRFLVFLFFLAFPFPFLTLFPLL